MDEIFFGLFIKILGIGHMQLSEFYASVEIPSILSTSYINSLTVVSDSVKDSVIEKIKIAGKEERQIALNSGNVDIEGVPVCTVVADGQWSKRSNKTKFNDFSGAVCIYIIFWFFNIFLIG